MQALMLDAATVEVVDAMRERDIEPILLKGLASQRWLWPDGSEEAYGDVDLLIDPDRFPDAGEVLKGLGFEVMLDDSDLPGQRPHGHHWLRGGVCIDMHRTIFGAERGERTCWEALSRDRDWIDIAGCRIAAPSIPARALHVAVHAIQHPGSLDDHTRDTLERAIAVSDHETWAAAAKLADEIGANAAFDAGLRAVSAGTAIAERLDLRFEPTSTVRRSKLGRPAGAHGIDQILEAESFRARSVIALRKMFPSRRLLEAWSPLARRGALGTAFARIWRPIWVIAQLPHAISSRRGSDR